MPDDRFSPIDPAVILGHIADALVLLSSDGTVLYANDAFYSMVGRAPGDVEGLRWRMDRDSILELKDVSDAIQWEKDRADRVMDSIADGIFTVDRDLVLRSFSTKMEQLTGIAAADAIGHPCRDVLHGTKCDDDCPLRRALDGGEIVERCREEFRAAADRHLSVSVTSVPVRDARGVVVGSTGVIRCDAKGETPPQGQGTSEAETLRLVLERHRWNQSRTAIALGISRTTLWRRMRRLGFAGRRT